MIRVTLPYPCSSNRYWSTRVIKAKATGKYMALTYETPEAKAYKAEVARLLAAAGCFEPMQGRARLQIDLYPNRPQDWQTRIRKLGPTWDDSVQCIDLGNAEKVLSDALQGVAIVDDKWHWEINLRRRVPDEHGARVELVLEPMPLQTDDLLGPLAAAAARDADPVFARLLTVVNRLVLLDPSDGGAEIERLVGAACDAARAAQPGMQIRRGYMPAPIGTMGTTPAARRPEDDEAHDAPDQDAP